MQGPPDAPCAIAPGLRGPGWSRDGALPPPDLIVLDDVVSLIDETPLTPSRCLAAALHPSPGLFCFRTSVIAPGLIAPGLTAPDRAMSIGRPFHAGVFLTDLHGWTGHVEAGLAGITQWDRQHGYRMRHLNDKPIPNCF